MEPEIPDNTSDQSEYIGSLIHEGFYDKLVLIGFPYDHGATLCGSKRGQDYGPDSFRRFVKDLGSIRNPEYGVDISKGLPSIADYGNIQIEGKPTQKQLMDKLTTKVNACIKRGNLTFVVGGTRDMTKAVVDGESKEKRKLVIMIRKCLDLKAVEQGEMHQRNSLRAILEKESFKSGHNKAIVVGMNLISETEKETFKQLAPSSEFYSIEDIRNFKQQNQGVKLSLQGSDFIKDIIAANPEYDQVYISISLEAVEGITGVSIPCVQGFSTEEIVEVCYQAGLNQPKLVSIDVADYNPFIEDWSTGRFLVLINLINQQLNQAIIMHLNVLLLCIRFEYSYHLTLIVGIGGTVKRHSQFRGPELALVQISGGPAYGSSWVRKISVLARESNFLLRINSGAPAVIEPHAKNQ